MNEDRGPSVCIVGVFQVIDRIKDDSASVAAKPTTQLATNTMMATRTRRLSRLDFFIK